MKFKDLEFEPHQMIAGMSKGELADPIFDSLRDAKQAIYVSKCGLEFSILLGKLFYSNGKDTYEVWVDSEPMQYLIPYQEPSGYLSKKEVVAYIKTACKTYLEEVLNEFD